MCLFRHCCWIGIAITIIFTLSASIAIFIVIQQKLNKIPYQNEEFETHIQYRDVSNHLKLEPGDQQITTTTIVMDEMTTTTDTNFEVDDECGVDISVNRISSGMNAELDEFPWLALLEYQNENGTSQFLCGGVLISTTFILTSAQCLTSYNLPNLISVRLGENDLTKRDDCFKNTVEGDSVECALSPIDVNVDEIFLHPNYTTNSSTYDVGLIRLADTVIYSDFVKPICIPHDSKNQSLQRSGEALYIAGWRNFTAQMTMKKKLRVKNFDHNKCHEKYSIYLDYEVNEEHTCISDGHRTFGICDISGMGDPLMRFDREIRSWCVEGILTYDYSCVGGKDWPAVYTNVGDYRDWIMSVIK